MEKLDNLLSFVVLYLEQKLQSPALSSLFDIISFWTVIVRFSESISAWMEEPKRGKENETTGLDAGDTRRII